MGLMDKLRGELVDIVEWLDDDRHTLVWRFPRYHNQIKQGARLIVRPGQLAVFVHRGLLADVFEPGTHRLATGNLPVLSTLQGWYHGFDSAFKAEVYFVSTRVVTDLKWGTPNPVIVRDADFGPVRVRAFGTYTLRAREPRTLVQQLVGTDGRFDAEEIALLVRSAIASAFAERVATSGISVVDLSRSYAALAEDVRQAAAARIDDEYGLELPQLWIVNVSVPQELEQAIDARASTGVVGDLATYQQYQLGRSTPTAAANPAGGLAAAGVGLGMGMAYVGAMGPGRGPTVVPPPPPPADASWFVTEAGQITGPFDVNHLRGAVAAGRFGPQTLVWTVGMAAWQAAAQQPALAVLFAPPPPPSPLP
jgi:membrane protease subunit (stomatin/prohibitin family)